MGKVATQNTLLDVNDKLKLLLTNNLHTIKNSGQMAEALFKELVQSGQASSVFDIGDQITVKWDSTGDGTATYDYDMDVVSFKPVTVIENGEPVVKPAMWLQSHNLLPTMAVSYSCPQAAAYVVNEITQPSGDDNFIYIILSWTIDSTNGRPAGIYYYKVPKDIPSIPAGSQITYSFAPNKALSVTVYNSSNASIISDTCTYTDQQSTINSLSGEKITITFGRLSTAIYPSDETNYKGDFFLPKNFTDKYVVNDHLYNVLYGRGVWQTSDICKWLNSDAPAGEWWKGHNIFARPPVDAWKNMPGFMFGLPSSFKKIIQQMSITTYFNGSSATSQQQQPIITKHFFFLPSATNEYITEGKNAYYSLEGHIFEYWKNLSTEPIGVDKAIARNSPHRRFLISDKTRDSESRCVPTMLRSRAKKDILNNIGYRQDDNIYQVKGTVLSTTQCGYAPVCVIY